MRRNLTTPILLQGLGVLGALAAPAVAQQAPPPMHSVPFAVHTGSHDGAGDDVRLAYETSVVEDGTIFNPFNTFAESAIAVPAGGIVSMVAGTYSVALGNAITVTKAMTIEAPVGTVVIGN